MASTCFAVVVLFLIKQGLAIPGDAVMYMPPLEVRTLDMNNGAFPFVNSQLFTGNRQFTPLQQQSTMQQSPMQRPTLHQSSMQQSSMEQPSMQQPSMQQPSMQQPSMQQPMMLQPTMQQLPMQQSSMPQFTPQSSVLHHTSVQTTTPEPAPTRPHERHNMTFNDFVEVLNEISERNKDSEEEESFESRAAGPSYGYSGPPPPSPSYAPYPSYQSYSRPSYAPPRPSYGSYGPPPPPSYHEPSYAPPAIHHHVSKAGKADLVSSLFKPTATKAASKLSGLIGIGLSLLSGSPGSSEFSGFKDIVINGIIKPLLIAKGGIKSLISKLAIPVIALLLINLEVLITVWWLWDDCPKPTYAYGPPLPPPPPAYNHSY